jgi:uncharacterized protein YjbJ (UPF0337 family)
MSFIDKARHKAEEVVGEVKEKVGELTGNDRLRAEGQKDQLSGNVKQTGDSVKDTAANLGERLKGDQR